MNTRFEPIAMIGAGVLIAAAAHYAPKASDLFLTAPASDAPPTSVSVTGAMHPVSGARVTLCQDTTPLHSTTGSSNVSINDNRGGYTVSIVDGELREIEVRGEYTLEEEGDTVRILDPDGDVAFETSKSNPTLGDRVFNVHGFEDAFGRSFGIFEAPGPMLERAVLDARVAPVDAAMAAQLGIESGALVEFVAPGSGAEDGGLAPFDVITTLDGDPVNAHTLTRALADHAPGDTVELGVIRAAKAQTLEIELRSAPAVAPAMDPFGTMPEFEAMRRMIEAEMREMEAMMRGLTAPTPPVRLRAPLPPAPRPLLRAPEPAPDTNDASDLAPKTGARPTPA